jgi:hypothetical protein
VLPLGAILAYATRQLGRVLSIAFSWATTTLFGRVPERKQLVLTVMAIASLVWPVALAGVLVPSVATFLLAFVTIPAWLDVWVRPLMVLFALALPALVGVLSRYLGDEPSGPPWRSVLRGYPTSLGLFVVLAWMLVLAPAVKVQALLRRWSSAHVAIAVKPNGYDRVVRDVASSLGRAGLLVHPRPAGWAFEVPGRLLGALGGARVRRLVPRHLVKLVRSDLEIVVHPMDLSMRGAERTVARAQAAITRELTFTEAYQTWTKEAQQLEDRLARAARGADDLDDIGRQIAALAIDHEQWEVLYRLFLQVRLRTSPVESDALVPEQDAVPPLAQRLSGIRRALRALWPPRRQRPAA